MQIKLSTLHIKYIANKLCTNINISIRNNNVTLFSHIPKEYSSHNVHSKRYMIHFIIITGAYAEKRFWLGEEVSNRNTITLNRGFSELAGLGGYTSDSLSLTCHYRVKKVAISLHYFIYKWYICYIAFRKKYIFFRIFTQEVYEKDIFIKL